MLSFLKVLSYDPNLRKKISLSHYRYRGFDIKLEEQKDSKVMKWNVYRDGKAFWFGFNYIKYACEQVENFRGLVYYEALEVEKERFS